MQQNQFRQYPTIIQAIHLIILYIFIQTLVDFPLAMIDYYKDTEYLYHPIKKIIPWNRLHSVYSMVWI
jgi:uncharacterized protein